jgi:hypothetical protein
MSQKLTAHTKSLEDYISFKNNKQDRGLNMIGARWDEIVKK